MVTVWLVDQTLNSILFYLSLFVRYRCTSLIDTIDDNFAVYFV